MTTMRSGLCCGGPLDGRSHATKRSRTFEVFTLRLSRGLRKVRLGITNFSSASDLEAGRHERKRPMLDGIDRDLVIRTHCRRPAARASKARPPSPMSSATAWRAVATAGDRPARSSPHPISSEPWNTVGSGAKNDPASYDPNSSAYKAAGKIVDGVFGGEIADPTGGMTHFYAPVAQSALGRDARNGRKPSKKIEATLFFRTRRLDLRQRSRKASAISDRIRARLSCRSRRWPRRSRRAAPA